jgi:MerR family transcriptional regulator, light-induced transcriptional regulator
MTSKYSIKDLERLSGVKAHTLRIWEQRYEILNPERTTTNIRYYSNDDLKRILNVSLLNNNGFKISNIAKLSEENLLKEVEKYLKRYVNESDQIESLVLSLMDMDETRFETTINNSVIHFGFENTVEKIIFPFLRHMGNMWQVGIISPAQEHYITNLIRQKLIVGLDKVEPQAIRQPKTFLLFLPNQEMHEMGLLYINYLLKVKGHKCLYLGQSVPLEDIVSISASIVPDYLISIFTSIMPDMTLNEFLKVCHEKIKYSKFLISGRLALASEEKLKLPSPQFKVFNDFEAFKKLIP